MKKLGNSMQLIRKKEKKYLGNKPEETVEKYTSKRFLCN